MTGTSRRPHFKTNKYRDDAPRPKRFAANTLKVPWERRLLSASAFPALATPIVCGLLLSDLRAALRVLLIDFGSIWPHLSNTRLALQIITLTVRMLRGSLLVFVATLFTDEIETHRATTETELVDNRLFQITTIRGIEALDTIQKKRIRNGREPV